MFHTIFYILLITQTSLCKSLCQSLCKNIKCYEENPAVKRLQEYVQIDTSVLEHTELVVDFWRRQAEEIGLDFAVYRPAALPICVLTLKGSEPDLPSIMLNSHSDVVPAYSDQWTYPPYSGHIDENGDMYGRGTQDTKDVGMQYVEAIRILKHNNVTLKRTLHVTVMPDEEAGGYRGMVPFVETMEFKSLNIGFALDEGMTSTGNNLFVMYQDRRPWQVKINIRGSGGHGSTIPNGTAVERLQKFINTAMEYRAKQMEIMNTVDPLDFGAYTTLNINMIEGGVAPNVIPTSVSVVIDLRLAVGADVNEVHNMLDSWMSELGEESSIGYVRRVEHSAPSAVNDSNPYWVAMQETMDELGITLVPVVCPATTDMVVIRANGIPAFGFSTKRNMTPRLHNSDEYISVDNYLEGIDIYAALLKKLGNLPDSQEKSIINDKQNPNY